MCWRSSIGRQLTPFGKPKAVTEKLQQPRPNDNIGIDQKLRRGVAGSGMDKVIAQEFYSRKNILGCTWPKSFCIGCESNLDTPAIPVRNS